ncbi:hypothetical protein IAT38_005475 [Cryptococcus sp. DSM 104549]
MKLPQYISSFRDPLKHQDPQPLLRLLACDSKTARGLADTVGPIDARRLDNPGHTLEDPWDGIAVRHCAAVYSLHTKRDLVAAFNHQDALISLFLRWIQNQPSWALPVLYVLLNDLRDLGERADQLSYESSGGKTPNLEACARTVAKAFSVCATDRQFTGAQSRRTGVYHLACMTIKCYFKVGKPNLCKNVIRTVGSDPKTPAVDTAPLPDQVTWHFYIGMLAFLNGEDKKADEELDWALMHCPAEAKRNQELILTYLIPLRLLRGQFPSPILLALHPRLQLLFSPFITAIKAGNVREYDRRLEWAQKRLVGMSVYLVVERAREGCMRMLFRKAWLASDKSARIPIDTFKLALAMHGVEASTDEVECMCANMVYRGYMRGYISHEKGMVVLSKVGPFPALTAIAR